MSKRKQVDWGGIEKEYRAGQLSTLAIAKKYGTSESTIRSRVKREGWIKDLTASVRQRANAKLSRIQSRTTNAQDDAKIVEDAADVAVAVVVSHRNDIKHARGICSMLLEELQDGTANRVLLSEIVDQQSDAEEWSDKAKSAASRAISLPARAGVMRDLATGLKTLVTLERQAFSIDDSKQSPRDALSDILEAVSDTSRGIDGYSNGD